MTAVALLTWGRFTVWADASVTFNEVMYHPATNEPALEWVELRNQMAVDVDISGWSIEGGVDFSFPSNSIVTGRGCIVVALSPESLRAATGLSSVYGPLTGRLANGGETLRLKNNSSRVVDELSYEVGGDWPVAPDGTGVSLAKKDPETPSSAAGNWTFSSQIGGTPGKENFPAAGQTTTTRLIALDTVWRLEGSGTDLGSAWRQVGYNDSAWTAWSPLAHRLIPALFNTGVDGAGTALAAGSTDPHYVMTAAAEGIVGGPATVIQNHSAWAANDSASSWIGVVNPGTASVSPGLYSYQTTFSLEGFLPGTVELEMSVAVDNDLTNVFLNGKGTGLAFSGFAAMSAPLVLAGGFNRGDNTLEFRTINGSTSANPHGFRALVSGGGMAWNTNQGVPAGRVTYCARKTFQCASDPARTSLKLNPVIADGAVVYLNGTEVYRFNLGAGAGYLTAAQTNVTAVDPRGWVDIANGSLVAGANVMAVELHQASSSPDGPLFGAELSATELPDSAIALAFNELSASTNGEFWLELVNYGTNNLSLSGMVVGWEGTTNAEYVVPIGTSLGAGECLAVTNTAMGFHPSSGDKLHLFSANRGRVLDSVMVGKGGRARWPNGAGEWLVPMPPSPGKWNSFSFRQEIVINEILYHAPGVMVASNMPAQASDEAWIELFNRGTNAVDLSGWKIEGGIQYAFPSGQSLGAGAYLVVAKDAGSLRAKYPGITVVGNFGGNLSHRGDRLVLREPSGNPADTVTYYSSGHWPSYADGGGSSLELRDANGDNSRPEAWAASDESGKSAWQVYRYQAIAQTVVGPNQWNEFVLGLLSDGECLVDDLSVVQSPGTSAVQFLSNGSFGNGLSGWRVLGNHGGSRVEADPANTGNPVLHLRASGPQEHMHNHVETTYAAGRMVTNGLTYEVSFRAKWLAGNNLLNTRLYFDRVAQTVQLARPTQIGTPGGAQLARFGQCGTDLQPVPASGGSAATR